MLKQAAIIYATLIALVSCSNRTDYVEWLYESMPLPDSLMYPRGFWEENVAKTIEVREKMHWNVPEREFRHFVLPLRVNNETLDDFRTTYADTLCARVKGMKLSEAALEINHWCHEQASYEPSDGRTRAPMATVRRGAGRCGEESVLTVAALRAAGIPSRQIYTPRWAHTDDNHAWVEVFTEDGKWHFMGSCEPAPTLDNAWFNGPISRALLLHTKVYGNYDGPEDVIQRTPCYTEINVIRNYVPARRLTATVMDKGNPVEGASVEFKIYNYAEFYTVATYQTGAEGTASLDTGIGDLLVWARKGDRFGFAKADSDAVTVTLDHILGERFSADIDIVPPPENPIPPGATLEQEEANKIRLAAEDELRASHSHSNSDAEAFLEKYGEQGRMLLAMLSEKGHGDVTMDVLEDALLVQSGDRYVLSPRVGFEPLLPFRREVLASGIAERLHSPEEVAQWVRDSIRLVEGRNPQGLLTAPVAVWRSRLADASARDIFFVVLCRTLGFPARIYPVDSEVFYLKNDADVWDWTEISLEDNSTCRLIERNRLLFIDPPTDGPMTRAEYYKHFTISKIDNTGEHLMEYGEGFLVEQGWGNKGVFLNVPSGYYLITSGTRLLDGSVLAHLEFTYLPENRMDNPGPVTLQFREKKDKLSVVGQFNVEMSFLPRGEQTPRSILSASGRGLFLIAVMGKKGHEPTTHAARALTAASDALNAWGRPVLILGDGTFPELKNVVYGTDPGGAVCKALFDGTYYSDKSPVPKTDVVPLGYRAPAPELPTIALCDSFGHIYYYSRGYNTALAGDLESIL